MKKRILALIITGCMIFSACGRESTETAPDMEDPSQPEAAFSFMELQNLTFFLRGSDSWVTGLTIHADGSFTGESYECGIGVWNRDYPNSAQYQCIFTGQFSQPEKVNDYTYSLQILSVSYADEPDTRESRNGIFYHNTTPCGLETDEMILVYLPGAPLAELPDIYRQEIGYYCLENTTDTELPFCGLYNETIAQGFSSYDASLGLQDHIAYIEEQAAALEHSIEHDALCQAELNLSYNQLWHLWDYVLSMVWYELKQTNDPETMRALMTEQSQWGIELAQAIEAAGAEYEGGTIQPQIMAQKGAEMTKYRVYELLALFDS